MRPSFFDGDPRRKAAEINASVEPGHRPVGASVFGAVTSKPGTYTLAIVVDAMQPGGTNPLSLSQNISVAVK